MSLSIDPIKPYLHAIEGVAILAVIGGLWFGLHHYGNTRYEEGRADDHKGWDADKAQWQQALDKQKSEAAVLLSTTIAQNDHLRQVNEALSAQREKDYESRVAHDADLARKYSSAGLRYVTVAAPAARCGQGGGGAVPGPASQAQPSASAVVQLPGVLAGNLQRLSLDASLLADAYAKCVAAVNGGPAL